MLLSVGSTPDCCSGDRRKGDGGTQQGSWSFAKRMGVASHHSDVSPQLARQPAAAEHGRGPQLETAQFYLQSIDCIGGNLAIVRKQTQVLILLLLFIKHRQRFAPGHLLLIVDLAEIENGSLHRFAGSDSLVFYDTEVAMIFAVFFAIVAV